MRTRIWLVTMCIAVSGLFFSGCRRANHQAAAIHFPQLAGEPDALFRINQNLTKPTLRQLLPSTITDPSGAVIASITDTQYCGPVSGDARVLVQITKGVSTTAPSNLLIKDCSLPTQAVVANHQSDADFDGIMELSVSWSNWKLSSTAKAFSPTKSSTFNQQESTVLESYVNASATDNGSITNGSDVQEPISLAFAFSPDTITIGAFQNAQVVSGDWSTQAPMESDRGYFTNNMQLAISQSLLQSLLQKYNTDLNYSWTSQRIQFLLSNFTESAISTTGSIPDGISVASQLTNTQLPGCTINLITNWTGSPLVFRDASAVPNVQGLCLGLAQNAQTELTKQLTNVQFIGGTSRDFIITLAGKATNVRFQGSFSTVVGQYMSIFGNGGIHAK